MMKDRFLKVPDLCSSRSIGHENITTEGTMLTYKKKKKIIAPLLSKALFLHGNRRVPFVILIVSQILAAIYTWFSINKGASPEVSSIFFLYLIFTCIIYAVVNIGEIKDYSKPASIWTKPTEESSLSRSAFLICQGLDTLIKEEDALRNGEGTNKHSVIRNRLVRNAALSSFFFNLLGVVIPNVVCPSVSFKQHFDASEWGLMCLCVGVAISQFMIFFLGLRQRSILI